MSMVVEKIEFNPVVVKQKFEDYNIKKNERKNIAQNAAMLSSALLCLASAAKADVTVISSDTDSKCNNIMAQQIKPEERYDNRNNKLYYLLFGYVAGMAGQIAVMSSLYNNLQRKKHELAMKNIDLEAKIGKKNYEISKLQEENRKMHKKLHPPTLEERREKILKTDFEAPLK